MTRASSARSRRWRAPASSRVVVGVVSSQVTERRGTVAGAPLLRLAPRSPIGQHARPRAAAARAASASARAARPRRGARPAGAAPGCASHRALTTADYYRAGYRRGPRPAPVAAALQRLEHDVDRRRGEASRAAPASSTTATSCGPTATAARRRARGSSPAEALFVRVADEVVTTSPGYAEELARALPDREPDARAQPARRRRAHGAPTERATAVYVGGLLRGRGLEQAIAALAHVPELRLALIGPVARGLPRRAARRRRETPASPIASSSRGPVARRRGRRRRSRAPRWASA